MSRFHDNETTSLEGCPGATVTNAPQLPSLLA